MNQRAIPLYQIDAFTAEPFHGNPAAVCLLPEALPDRTMQEIAAEMNLSETAFLQRIETDSWRDSEALSLRWFTPETEVDLCGHGTLAAAAALFQVVEVAAEAVTFHTRSGDLIARQQPPGILLDFPADPPEPCTTPPGVLEALHLDPEAVENTAYGAQTRKLLLHLKRSTTLHQLKPDFSALLKAESMKAFRGLIVTAAGAPPYDFLSRYFAPWVGIPEDPVTGSAHTLLIPYWEERLGKVRLHAYQASPRGGELWGQRIPGDQTGGGRIALTGQACVVFKGKLYLSEA